MQVMIDPSEIRERGEPLHRPANAALYYHPDGYETRRKELMGRHAAGESFLTGLVKYGRHQQMYCFAQTREHYQHLLSKVKESALGPKICSWIPWHEWRRLSESGCLIMPSPTLKDLCWQRRHLSPRAYSLCGITHTTATKTVMDAIGDLLTTPMQPWDALICTSQSVKSMVTEVLDNYGEFIRDQFGLPAIPRTAVQLPVIPLGVHVDDFDKTTEEKSHFRKIWREKLRLAPEVVAFLFVGRFSSFGKCHPVPMFLGLERAARMVSQPIHLIMAGWFPSAHQQNEFINAAKQFCPSVVVHIVDGRLPEVRQQIWYAADVFTSLSDNVQETFGLTPVEAMAAGLPSVISDWDGYKETVRDEVDGFRIRTWMSTPGLAEPLAEAHANLSCNYDQYIGQQALLNVVDVGDSAAAYARLASDANLRMQMGECARKQARKTFDWRVIVPQYEELWTELAAIRQAAAEPARPAHSFNPLRDDPSRLFQSYSTCHLTDKSLVRVRDQFGTEKVERLSSLTMNRLAAGLALPQAAMVELVASLGKEPMSVAQIAGLFGSFPKEQIERSLLWLAKMDIISLDEADCSPASV